MRLFYLILSVILFAQCNEKRTSYSNRIAKNDIQLENPVAGDWLYEHDEKGQTFRQYKNAKPVKPSSKQSIIYIQPIGSFTPMHAKELMLLQQYLEIYFQTDTKLLNPIEDQGVPKTDRRIHADGQEQLHAPYILDKILKPNMPDSAIVFMGISEKDLYPKPAWNFVFGLAYLKQRVGVSSLYRMQEGKLNGSNFKKSLQRILKISSHEIGHMFTIKHCTYAQCVMNGANHMQETDDSPMRLCSVCQQKLQYSIAYDAEKRLKELIAFLGNNKLIEDKELLEKDL